MSDVVTLTQANFEEEVLHSDIPVIVDYWAPWCGPCRVIAPAIEQIAAERAGSLKVGKVNVDEEPQLAQLAGVHGIPFVALYRDGRAFAHAVGARPKEALERALGLDATAEAAA
jgi:thioredoxin 1